MMSFLAGGLEPILWRFALDGLAILGLGHCVMTFPNTDNATTLVAICLFTLATAGPTNRWTMTIPMVPLVLLQSLRYFIKLPRWAALAIKLVSGLCLVVAILLSLLFPAVQLPKVSGPYNVGVIDLHLPVNFESVYSEKACNNTVDGYVSAKIIYPTLEKPESVPYIRPHLALDYLRLSMLAAAPPPLNEIFFMLHNWRMIRMSAKPNATPLDVSGGLPLVTYSHGLGGSSMVYSFQTFSLAANGHVVVAIDHTDGSVPVVERKDGSLLFTDTDIVELWKQKKFVEYANQRRERTELRAREVLAATLALRHLNEENIREIESRGVSFVGKLKTSEHYMMGHSFGAAAALTAGFRRPDLTTSIIAHEPATDWAPNDIRRAMMPQRLMNQCPIETDGGTGGWGTFKKRTKGTVQDMRTLFLFSQEWYTKDWGYCHQLEWIYKTGKAKGMELAIVPEVHHNEFSDVCMLTPLWLARAVGVTGQRDPIETAKEINDRTLAFIKDGRQ